MEISESYYDGRLLMSEVARRGRVPVWDRKREKCKITTAAADMALWAACSRINITDNTFILSRGWRNLNTPKMPV